MNDSTRYDETNCVAVFDRLFPQGFAGDDVLDEIAPERWARSPLAAAFHPSVDQIYEECVQLHRNMQSLWGRDARSSLEPPATRDEIAREFKQTPIETEREVRELVGMCVWDVFSDNHEVIDANQRVVDLGSFRVAGGFIADYVNRCLGSAEYDYIDFYLGTIWVAQRADLMPVYRMLFRRLITCDLDWIYHFPKLHLIDLQPLRDALEHDKTTEWANYDPGEAIVKVQAEEERQRELTGLRASLDEAHRDAIEKTRQDVPPQIIIAYQSVYGRFPRGWPPNANE